MTDEMTDTQRSRIFDRRNQAWWYYAGREDAGGHQGDAWGFSKFAADEARLYEAGEATFLPSIRDQYERHTQGETS